MADVTVVGSVNLDVVATADRLPRPGETITGATLDRHPGGKGANQALAAARAGADTSLVAAVGRDAEADLALALLVEAGVDLGRIKRCDDPTGIALIAVDASGENQIIVAPGANRSLRSDDLDPAPGGTVLCQLEIEVDVVRSALDGAELSVLNCAPARELPAELFEMADVIVVNETEREYYGTHLASHPLCIVTLGARGAVALRQGSEVARAVPPRVEVVDTVGAGDTFVGYLSVELGVGRSIQEALEVAVVAGALATTRPGAQPSIPDRLTVNDLMARA